MDFNPLQPRKLLLVSFILQNLCSCSSSSANFPIAKSGCPDRCGNVSIPFPFGVGEGCYLDESFSVECDSSELISTGSPFPITNISLDGQIRTSNYVAQDCYDRQNRSVTSFSVMAAVSEPFMFNSTGNKFTVIGCDSVARVEGTSHVTEHATTSGCTSLCNLKKEVEDGSCSSIGCCQTSIPSGSWMINVTLTSSSNHSSVLSFNPCGFAFVVAEDAFRFYADNLTNLESVETLPVIVDWVISYNNCDEAKSNKRSYTCGVNSECYVEKGAWGYRCRCNEGYEGNPYLGCQDIDECVNPQQCGKNSACTNTLGSFECHCKKGYRDDGEGRCVAKTKKNNWLIIVGVCLSAGSVSLLILSFCFYSEWVRRKEKRIRDEFFMKNGGLILLQKLSTAQGRGSYSTKVFTHEELRKATDGFEDSRIIGRGGFGTVFKGELNDKTVVAIKKPRGLDEHQAEQFINEVILLSQINSRYVVKLLGCCLETEVPLLVYEYIDNGTLFEHLHNKVQASKLSWNIRLRIASEIASVLSYLHSVASPPIIHRDIKSSNILLDKNYTAKVSDFGISRLISTEEDQVATMVQGTLGYLDPEYMQTGLLNEKSDVYSFGIVMIELITGKKALASNKPEAEKFLSNSFLVSVKENQLAEILDRNISRLENIDQLNQVAMIAKRCISVRGEDRPCMKDVERELAILGAKAKEISIHALEIESSRDEGSLAREHSNSDVSMSTSKYSGSYIITEQPLLAIYGGR